MTTTPISSNRLQNSEFLIAKPGEPIVNITPFTARQKASGYVGSYISHLMGGDEPSLLLSNERLVWRVPIVFTSPTKGKLGIVGSLDIDARTGQLLISPDFALEVEKNAQKFIAIATH